MEMLKELSIKTAVSGNENNASLYIKSLFEPYCDSTEVDRFHNVIGIKKGEAGGKRIMVTAHYDEIGFIVSGIDDKGFVKFSNIGGIDSKILLSQEVIIHGKRDVYGIIGAKPPHLLNADEVKKAVKKDSLVIDIGMDEKKAKELLSIGDVISFKAEPFSLKGNKLSAKSLDNRAGVAAAVLMLKELDEIKLRHEVTVVATVQEEVGLRGANIAAFNVHPDIAIVIDACHGDMTDVPKVETFNLGKGPAVGIGPNLHRKLSKKIMDIASEENIPYQVDVEPGDTGTEAWAIQVSRLGVPVILLSIPLRYMHTTIETLSEKDVKNTARLAARFISRLHEMEGILCY